MSHVLQVASSDITVMPSLDRNTKARLAEPVISILQDHRQRQQTWDTLILRIEIKILDSLGN